MKDFVSRVAAITGAGSGIGRALAIELAGEGCHLALADIDKTGLDETAEMVRWAGARMTTHTIDVADRTDVDEWARQVLVEHGSVHLLVDNARMALGAPAKGQSYGDVRSLTGVDLWNLACAAKAFVPHLQAAGEGHIVNVLSMSGLLGVPSRSAYSAAKLALRDVTEKLRVELDLERRAVSLTTIHVGGLKPKIAGSAGAEVVGRDPAKRLPVSERAVLASPERAARAILRAVATDKRQASVGMDAHLYDMLAHLPPGVGQSLIGLGTRFASRWSV